MTEPLRTAANAGPLADVIHGLLNKDPDAAARRRGRTPAAHDVADAPDAPIVPVADATRTMPLPADPQPTPTDAPAAARKAAADQARVRSRLRSVRNAAAAKPNQKSRPKPEPAPAPAQMAAVGLPSRQRRVVIITAIAVILAALGTAIGFVLANVGNDSGGSSEKDAKATHAATAGSGKKSSGPAGQSASTAPTPSRSAGSEDSGGKDRGKTDQVGTAVRTYTMGRRASR